MPRYGDTMIDTAVSPVSDESVENILRDELAQGDAAIGTMGPILRHLLANDDHSVFSDEIIARVRGMFADVSRQLLDAIATASGNDEDHKHDRALQEALAASLSASPAFLGHAHALALEWQLTERLHARLALDPVLSPLLQALIASPDAVTAQAAMALLASQARFVQSQRRMRLPLTELPGDLLHGALLSMRAIVGDDPEADATAAKAESAVRMSFDESRSRAGLIARLVTGMGGGAVAALSVGHAGVAMFLSAMAFASGQDRDLAVLATNEGQLARLALALRAAGMKPAAIEEQFLALHPEIALPDGFESLGADRAAAILAVSGSYPVG
jgi:hypothetical protein